MTIETTEGRGERPRVLVVPGLDGDAGLLRAAAPRLFRGLRPLLFDHRLDCIEGGVEGLAERALGVLDADPESDTPAYVCGESFGGTVALTLARRYPRRVRGLILLSTFGWYPWLPTCSGRLGLAVWRLLGDRLARQMLRWWRPISAPGTLGRACPAEVRRAFLAVPPLHLPGYRAKCEIALTFDARPWLAGISCPTFILIGSWDPVVPTAAGRALARLLPNARLHVLPGRHLVHVVRADEAGALLARWVADTRAGGGPPLVAQPARGAP